MVASALAATVVTVILGCDFLPLCRRKHTPSEPQNRSCKQLKKHRLFVLDFVVAIALYFDGLSCLVLIMFAFLLLLLLLLLLLVNVAAVVCSICLISCGFPCSAPCLVKLLHVFWVLMKKANKNSKKRLEGLVTKPFEVISSLVLVVEAPASSLLSISCSGCRGASDEKHHQKQGV